MLFVLNVAKTDGYAPLSAATGNGSTGRLCANLTQWRKNRSRQSQTCLGTNAGRAALMLAGKKLFR